MYLLYAYDARLTKQFHNDEVLDNDTIPGLSDSLILKHRQFHKNCCKIKLTYLSV